jgi:hypothetical protein
LQDLITKKKKKNPLQERADVIGHECWFLFFCKHKMLEAWRVCVHSCSQWAEATEGFVEDRDIKCHSFCKDYKKHLFPPKTPNPRAYSSLKPNAYASRFWWLHPATLNKPFCCWRWCWGLNSGLCVCRAGAAPLEPFLL